MKSRIKTFNPIVITNRLVPKKDDTTHNQPHVPKQIVPKPIDIKNEIKLIKVQSLFTHQSDYFEKGNPLKAPKEIPHKIAFLNEPLKFSTKSKVYQKNQNASKEGNHAMVSKQLSLTKTKQSSQNQSEIDLINRVTISKDKNDDISSELSFYDSIKAESNRILERKYKEIEELKGIVESLLSDKDSLLKQVLNKNKRIELLTNENKFKQIRLKESQINMRSPRNSKKLRSSSILSQSHNFSQFDMKMELLNIDKEKEISEFLHSSREIKMDHEIQINLMRGDYSKKVEQIQKRYEEKIAVIQRRLTEQKRLMQEEFNSHLLTSEGKHLQERSQLEIFYNQKVKDLTNLYEQKIKSLLHPSFELKDMINNLNQHHEKEKGLMNEKFNEEKEILQTGFKQQIEAEKHKYSESFALISQKIKHYQTQIDRLQNDVREKQVEIQDLKKEVAKKEVQNEQMLQSITVEKNKYLRIQDLWCEQRRNNERIKEQIKSFMAKDESNLHQICILKNQIANAKEIIDGEYEKTKKMKQTWSRAVSQKNKEITRIKNDQKNILQENVRLEIEAKKFQEQKKLIKEAKEDEISLLMKIVEELRIQISKKEGGRNIQEQEPEKKDEMKRVEESKQMRNNLNEVNEKILNVFARIDEAERKVSSLQDQVSEMVDEQIQQESKLLSIRESMESPDIMQILQQYQNQNERLIQTNLELKHRIQNYEEGKDSEVKIQKANSLDYLTHNPQDKVEAGVNTAPQYPSQSTTELTFAIKTPSGDSEEGRGDQRDEITSEISDQARIEKMEVNNEGEFNTNELLEELEEKQFVIEEMSQCIEDYKEMVWEMKQRLENQENYQENYEDVLQIFNLESEASHTDLIQIINNYTSKVNEMMKSLEQLEELTKENECLQAGKKKFIKELKKCQILMERMQANNNDLEQRLQQESELRSNLQKQNKELTNLLTFTNEELAKIKSQLLGVKLELKDCKSTNKQIQPVNEQQLSSDKDQEEQELIPQIIVHEIHDHDDEDLMVETLQNEEKSKDEDETEQMLLEGITEDFTHTEQQLRRKQNPFKKKKNPFFHQDQL